MPMDIRSIIGASFKFEKAGDESIDLISRYTCSYEMGRNKDKCFVVHFTRIFYDHQGIIIVLKSHIF